ncbi:MAG: hypothetical protein C0596_06400 [Marinilabiliales bacterium]|nr:MAG: hypothetical protein C0596_06400 [Marinilabiliales bacterium]
MKKLFLFAFVIFVSPITSVFGQNTELQSQSKEQLIDLIDNIVLEIQNERYTYRKIICETDNLINSKIQTSNINQCVFKKEKEIKIVQLRDENKNETTNYYINNGKLIYAETKNNDKTIDKTYYHPSISYLVAYYKCEKEISFSNEEKMKMGIALQ